MVYHFPEQRYMKNKKCRKTFGSPGKAHAEICPSGGNPSLGKSQDIT